MYEKHKEVKISRIYLGRNDADFTIKNRGICKESVDAKENNP